MGDQRMCLFHVAPPYSAFSVRCPFKGLSSETGIPNRKETTTVSAERTAKLFTSDKTPESLVVICEADYLSFFRQRYRCVEMVCARLRVVSQISLILQKMSQIL